MRFDGNGECATNYRPKSLDDLVENENYKGLPYELDSNIAGYFDRNENDDNH
jgi:catalase